MSMNTAAFARWFQRKRYQYEVTFSLYMLTPTEKFIFNSILFLVVMMVIIGAALYLPQHINFLTTRAWFYYHGEEPKEAIRAIQSIDMGTVRSLSTASMDAVAATKEL